jgi:RNA polymerase sigma factor (sigma-70 family)
MAEHTESSKAVMAKIEEALDNSNHLITKCVGRFLSQHSLDTSLVHDVLSDAYIRASQCSTEITNPEGWLRKVCLNIVRERKRDQQRFVSEDLIEHNLSMLHLDQPEFDEVIINGNPISFYEEALRKVWEELPSDQQVILGLRILQDKSWKEVAKAIAEKASESINETTIRQRGHRALTSLKNKLK